MIKINFIDTQKMDEKKLNIEEIQWNISKADTIGPPYGSVRFIPFPL